MNFAAQCAILAMPLLFGAIAPAAMAEDDEGEAQPGLMEFTQGVRYAPSCGERVPIEHHHSYPVPVLHGTRERYRLFFYALTRKSAQHKGSFRPEVLTPQVAAVFSAGLEDVRCEDFAAHKGQAGNRAHGLRFSPAAAKLDLAAFDAEEARLYAATEKAAAAYLSGAGDAAAKSAATDFFTRFVFLAEPGFKPFYHELSPGFWKWMEKVTGQKLQ